MSGEWVVLRNQDLIRDGTLEINDGYRAKTSIEMGEPGLPFLRAANLNDGFDLHSADILHEDYVPRAGHKVSMAGDVVFTSKGTVGRFAFVKPSTPKFVYSPQVCFWRVHDTSTLDPRFLFFWMQGQECQTQMYQVKGLTDMADYVNLKDQRQMHMTVPPLPIQHRIASILSAYDDLIENNTQRIKALEAAAQALYREWFVEFRFPGWQQVEWVESELGSIPKGWAIASLGGITTKIGSGATPRGGKEAYNDTGISLIRSLNVYDYHFDLDGLAFIDEEQADDLSNVVVESNDVLLNITGASVARCCMVPSWILPARVNQHVAIVRAEPISLNPHYLLHTLNSYRNKEMLLTLAQAGATREALTKSKIEDFKVILPPVDVQNRFAELIGEGRLIENLEHRSRILRETRDLLLPRLISGELSVE